MDIQALYAALRQYGDVMALNAPAVLAALAAFEEAQCLKLPLALRELLACFNGGEIFIPGTTIYGTEQEGAYSLAHANAGKGRFSIPEPYLVFAKLNFGDLLAINMEAPHDVIQWDHEADEEFDRWDSLEAWLDEAIQDYDAYIKEQL